MGFGTTPLGVWGAHVHRPPTPRDPRVYGSSGFPGVASGREWFRVGDDKDLVPEKITSRQPVLDDPSQVVRDGVVADTYGPVWHRVCASGPDALHVRHPREDDPDSPSLPGVAGAHQADDVPDRSS